MKLITIAGRPVTLPDRECPEQDHLDILKFWPHLTVMLWLAAAGFLVVAATLIAKAYGL